MNWRLPRRSGSNCGERGEVLASVGRFSKAEAVSVNWRLLRRSGGNCGKRAEVLASRRRFRQTAAVPVTLGQFPGFVVVRQGRCHSGKLMVVWLGALLGQCFYRLVYYFCNIKRPPTVSRINPINRHQLQGAFSKPNRPNRSSNMAVPTWPTMIAAVALAAPVLAIETITP